MSARPSLIYAWLLVLTISLVMISWRLWPVTSSPFNPQAAPREVEPRGELSDVERTTIAIFRDASPSVVHITTLVNKRRDPFSFNVQQIPEGTGSGIVWNNQGHIVTNFHVIRRADAAVVVLADQTSWPAKLLGVYPDKDLAVLSIEAPPEKLAPIAIGSSTGLVVGQAVYAIGNPFGLDQTLTTGVVSALGREIQSLTGRTIKRVIQIDAAINPGNSGGPLLDSAGRLIGVNSSILSPSGVSAGIGFAIPVDEVNRVVTQLIRTGRVVRPGIGADFAEDIWSQRLELPGVLVLKVDQDGPAEQAGIRPTRQTETGQLMLGDVIIAVNGHPVRNVNGLLDAIEEHKIGDEIAILVVRGGEQEELTVTLAEHE